VSASLVGPLLILCASLLFSTGGTAIKLTSFSAWQVACLRSSVAFVFLALLRPAWRSSVQPRVLLVAAPYAALLVLFVSSNKLTTAANAIFLQSTSLLWVLLLGPLLLQERPYARDLGFGAAIALGMGLLFFGGDPPVHTAPNPAAGNALGAFAGLMSGLSLLGLRWLAGTSGLRGPVLADTALVGASLLSALACAPLAFPIGSHPLSDWLVVLYLGVFQMGLAFLCMARGLQRLTAIEAALLMLLEPVLSLGWAWLVHDEQPTAVSLTGCVLILCATVGRALSSMRRVRAPRPTGS